MIQTNRSESRKKFSPQLNTKSSQSPQLLSQLAILAILGVDPHTDICSAGGMEAPDAAIGVCPGWRAGTVHCARCGTIDGTVAAPVRGCHFELDHPGCTESPRNC